MKESREVVRLAVHPAYTDLPVAGSEAIWFSACVY